MSKVALALWLMAFSAHAVGLRVATFNIGAHFGQNYFDYSLGDPGTVDHETVKAILDRIDADVVALEEIHSVDLQGSPDDLDALAGALGYPYLYIPPTSGVFDTSLRVVFLSRFPFLQGANVGSPPGAKEVTRYFPAVTVDVPGTANDPLIIGAHLKSGTTQADKFRRAIEMRRLVEFVNDVGVQPTDNFIILGDFNPSANNTTFTSPPDGLPSTYSLGSDVSFPVSYSTNMVSYFSGVVPTRLDPRQLNGSPVTFELGSKVLDLLMVSPALAGRPYGTEIYNSALDTSNTVGLAKSGAPLASSTSADASDHFAIFADFELDPDLGSLAISSSLLTLTEGGDSATLVVNLPSPIGSDVLVELSAADPLAMIGDPVLTIPAGSSSGSTTLALTRDFVATGDRTVEILAGAGGYDSSSVQLEVIDPDLGYSLGGPEDRVTESFDGFDGGHAPAPWVSDGVVWLGTDDGSSNAQGARAFGTGSEQAVGYASAGDPMVLETSIHNAGTEPITLLDLSYDAEIWKWTEGGASDSIKAYLVCDGESLPLPGLDFAPPAAAMEGTSQTLAVRVGGLDITPGETVTVEFHFVPGEGGGTPSDAVWINEFHYDNVGDDGNEFVEVVVGPGYDGDLSSIQLLLYNGTGGAVYDSATLDTFAAGPVSPEGYRIFHKAIEGIQNGAPDGFALVVDGAVTEFISYEGSFVATSGAAVGMTSVDVGVSQSALAANGVGSVRRVGTGSRGDEFSWARDVALDFSQGAPNAGQMLVSSGLAPQGLAIDNFSVVWVADRDGDGLADDVDTDDDNDGQSDLDELAFGTDPLDAGSIFVTRIVGTSGSPRLEFPGAEGIIYTIEWCDDLISWDQSSTVEGNGAPVSVSLPAAGQRWFVRVRVGN